MWSWFPWLLPDFKKIGFFHIYHVKMCAREIVAHFTCLCSFFFFFFFFFFFWLIASDKYLALSYTLISKNLCACVCSSARVQDSECLPDDPLS